MPNISRAQVLEHVKIITNDGTASSLRTTLFDCMMEKCVKVIERLDLRYELESDIPGQDSVGYHVSYECGIGSVNVSA